jgi:two-component system cell cycle response regulator DivK
VKVLVADDEEMNRELLRAMLERIGHDVEEAVDGWEAVERASAAAPAAVLMDIRMPRLDGFAALAWLRSNAATSSIPVIAVTAFAMDGERERIEAAGFDGYVSKPVDIDRLKVALARLEVRGNGTAK